VRDPHWIAVAWVADVCERPLCLGGDQLAWRAAGSGAPVVLRSNSLSPTFSSNGLWVDPAQ
jgi:hypothetical protein